MSTQDAARRLAAEQRARVLIDQQLTQAGWRIQDESDLNLVAAQGIAVREVVMKPAHGRVDYLLYVDRAAALTLTEDETAALASRLARLELELTDAELFFSQPRSAVASPEATRICRGREMIGT